MQRPEAVARPRGIPRRRIGLIVAVFVVFILLTSLRGVAVFYTDFLWFHTQGLTRLWSGVLGTKVALAAVFTVVFFVLAWGNLALVDRLAIQYATLGQEDELVRRYRSVVQPRSRLLRTIVSIILALLIGTSAAGQWNNWLLFANSVPFGQTDPQFHKDISFYVFRLPFLTYLVDWGLGAVFLVSILVAGISYLNGGIRPKGPGQRVSAQVKVHLSVLLAVLALLKAVGYWLARYHLVTSTDGYLEGAFYTDVHARLPALTLLMIISLFAFVILLVNIRRQGWVLPAIAVGLWALISVLVGTIYPAIVQKFSVNPSQVVMENPYITLNINATRTAFDLNSVTSQSYAASGQASPSDLDAHTASLNDVRLWDPSLTQDTFDRLQDIRAYYQFAGLTVNRYELNGSSQPVIVGVRQLNSSQLPAQSWVNLHLQYTHGYGAVMAPAAQATSEGNPNFVVQDIPPTSNVGAPTLTQPSVYFGLGMSGYVIADSKQAEIDYQDPTNGASIESHYTGTGGVPVSSLLDRAAFALRLADINVLISDQIGSGSRILFVRDVQDMVSKSAPFLTLDSSPYPVIYNGQVDWVQDAYTTSDEYPYSQAAATSTLSSSSGLANQTVNYVRNSVKVVVNAYTGQMSFYLWDPTDPIIQAYAKAFPGLFQPASSMPAGIADQLRYPYDLFTLQAQTLGRYHITNASSFYNGSDAWTLSADPGAAQQTAFGVSTGPVTRMQPEYSEVQLPGQTQPNFVLMEPFVPLSTNDRQQNLTSFLVAESDQNDYGDLTLYVTPRGQQIDGPALVGSKINANTVVSSQISLLDQHGSSVTEGTVMLVPLNQSLLYVRPLYVQASTNSLPEVKEVIVVSGNTVSMQPTLLQALDAAFGTHLSTGGPSSTSPTSPSGPITPVSPAVATLVKQADQALAQAQSDLISGDLGGYQAEVNQAKTLLDQADSEQSALSTTRATVKSGSTATT